MTRKKIRSHAVQLTELEIDLLAALKQLMKAYESVLPGLAHIAVPDYALINDAPVAAERAIGKAERIVASGK